MKELQHQLGLLLQQSGSDPQIITSIVEEKSVFPFSMEGRIMAYLLATNAMSYSQYMELHRAYVSRNQYLDLFEMAPRTFGETWGEKHILSLFPEFIKATKESVSSLYPNFDGEFDLWLDGIRVEVKACRANSSKNGGSLASRAYLHKEATGAAVYEGQVFMTEEELSPFLVEEKDILNIVRIKGNK